MSKRLLSFIVAMMPLMMMAGITVYVQNASSGACKLHVWESTNDLNGEWNSDEQDVANYPTKTIGDDIYHYKTFNSESISVILHNGNGQQTEAVNGIASDIYLKYYGGTDFSDETYGSVFSLPDCAEYIPDKPFCYFENAPRWATPKAYVWENGVFPDWPGVAMEPVGTNPATGSTVYRWQSDGNVPGMIIFSDDGNNQTQTGNLTFVNGGYYTPNGLVTRVPAPDAPKIDVTIYARNAQTSTDAPYYYDFGGLTGDYPGTAMTQSEVLADGFTWYKYTYSQVSSVGFLLNNGDGDATKTTDIKISAAGTYYVKYYPAGSGDRFVITTTAPAEGAYSVTGENGDVFTGGVWNVENAFAMTKDADGVFHYVATPEQWIRGSFQYRVASGGAWTDEDGLGRNKTVEISQPGKYSFDFTYTPATKTVACATTLVTPYTVTGYCLAGSSVELFGVGAWARDDANMMVPDGDTGNYTLTLHDRTLQAGNIEYKVFANKEDIITYPANNAILEVPAAGTYDVTFTFNPETGAVNATIEASAQDPEGTTVVYVYSEEENAKVYAWTTVKGTLKTDAYPGNLLSSYPAETVDGVTYRKITFDVGAINLVFSVGEGGPGNQTANIDGVTGDENYYVYPAGGDPTRYTVGKYELPKLYILGTLNGKTWAPNDGIEMTRGANGKHRRGDRRRTIRRHELVQLHEEACRKFRRLGRHRSLPLRRA